MAGGGGLAGSSAAEKCTDRSTTAHRSTIVAIHSDDNDDRSADNEPHTRQTNVDIRSDNNCSDDDANCHTDSEQNCLLAANGRRQAFKQRATKAQRQRNASPAALPTTATTTTVGHPRRTTALRALSRSSLTAALKKKPRRLAIEMRRTLRQYQNVGVAGHIIAGGFTSSRLYSPWTVFALAIVFFLLLYIPLFQQYPDVARMYPISGWDVNTTRDTALYVLPDRRTTIIEPSLEICEAEGPPLLLLIVVCSAVSNFELRDAIRQTWANTSEFNYSFFRQAHAAQRGQYLAVNQADWSNYTTDSHAPSDDRQRPEYADFGVKIVFLVGQLAPESAASPDARSRNATLERLQSEADRHGDLVQEHFHDTYNNLTLKSVMMLKWTLERCAPGRLRYLMKCDDDTFVNVPNLLHVLLGGTIPVYNATALEFDPDAIRMHRSPNRLRSDRSDLLMGNRFCNSKPFTNINSKWYAPLYMFAGSVYPPYLSGTGYVMSLEVARRLYAVALRTPVFHLEDVYLTGMCAQTAHVRRVNHPLFSYTAYRDRCEALGMITKHEMAVAEMRSAYATIRRTAERAARGEPGECNKPDQREAALRKAKIAAAAAAASSTTSKGCA